MIRKLEYLTIVGNTAYFFCKQKNYLLPIPITVNCLENLLNSKDYVRPHIHNTFIRTLSAFGTKVESVRIYDCIADTFLSYIRVTRETTELEINSNFEDCLIFAITEKAEVEIEEKLLLKRGFFVSREMIEKALIENETI